MIKIIVLRPDDWEMFKQIRLLALTQERSLLSSSYERECVLDSESWRSRISGCGHQVFGLFDSKNIIGITAVTDSLPGWREDPSGQTANMAMSFILPEYRRLHLSQMLYDARFSWILKQTQFKRIQVSHRITNIVSQKAITRNGFKLKGRVCQQWFDGTIDDELLYEMSIEEARLLHK